MNGQGVNGQGINGSGINGSGIDVDGVRRHFAFPATGRVVTNNAASTQPPRELTRLFADLAPGYENVHRGQSAASRAMTERFEASYDTVADFLGAPSRRSIAFYRGTTEAVNAVMYGLLTTFRDGDNVVTTALEHNSDHVPWHALCHEILPAFGRRVEHRVARFDPATGELDLDHLASLVDARTVLVGCTGASNFLGTKPPLHTVRDVASSSGHVRPDGGRGSYLLVDGAQLVPGGPVDVVDLDADFLAFSFHKVLAPFGVGVLYGKEHLLATVRPFLYGGDMVAEGGVSPDRVKYAGLPWRHAAGTPDILGTIVSAQGLRLLVDLALDPLQHRHFGTDGPLPRNDVRSAMGRVAEHGTTLVAHALERLNSIPGLTVHGPADPARRTPLVAFTVEGRSPVALAEGLDAAGIEARAGCHCAALAHHALGLLPEGSCRLSFALYNTLDEVDAAADALADVVAGRRLLRAG